MRRGQRGPSGSAQQALYKADIHVVVVNAVAILGILIVSCLPWLRHHISGYIGASGLSLMLGLGS